MAAGWIKTSRTDLNTGLLKKDNVYRLLAYLRFTAVFLPETWSMNGVSVHLEPGQMITGRKVLAKALHLTEAEIRTAIQTLKKLHLIHVKSTNRYSLITLINQEAEEMPAAGSTSRISGNQPAAGRKNDHIRKEVEFKEGDCLKEPEEACPSPSAVLLKNLSQKNPRTIKINGRLITASYQQKIIKYCNGNIWSAGRIFYRASRKAKDIVSWIEGGLKRPEWYALKPVEEESTNPRAVDAWIESTFFSDNEPMQIGDFMQSVCEYNLSNILPAGRAGVSDGTGAGSS